MFTHGRLHCAPEGVVMFIVAEPLVPPVGICSDNVPAFLELGGPA